MSENPAGTIDPVSAGGAVVLVDVPTVEPDATNDKSAAVVPVGAVST